MRIELCRCTETILEEISDKRMKQGDIALTYALALRSTSPTDWARVNRSIIDRWSVSGLERIKKMAWERNIAGRIPNRERNNRDGE